MNTLHQDRVLEIPVEFLDKFFADVRKIFKHERNEARKERGHWDCAVVNRDYDHKLACCDVVERDMYRTGSTSTARLIIQQQSRDSFYEVVIAHMLLRRWENFQNNKK